MMTLEEVQRRTGFRIRANETVVGGQGVCIICGALCTRRWWADRQVCFVCERRMRATVHADPLPQRAPVRVAVAHITLMTRLRDQMRILARRGAGEVE